jgi:hypothetical protein
VLNAREWKNKRRRRINEVSMDQKDEGEMKHIIYELILFSIWAICFVAVIWFTVPQILKEVLK